MYTGHSTNKIEEMCHAFRDQNLPLDVVGLEPGWQTHAYPSSFVWDGKRAPDPAGFIRRMGEMNLHVNLWEHCFTHRDSPIYDELNGLCGDYTVWGGRTPDLALEKARAVFGGYHDRELIGQGISGFKMDECDGSDYTGGWSFPNTTAFPSGLDGEQMHSLIGLLYQDTLLERYEARNLRSYHSVRNSHALAASRPAVLYSDLYDHRDFIRGVVTMGFSGLLWSPEVRDAKSPVDLIRRLQTVIFSPQALINAWYIANPPWFQIEAEANNQGIAMEGWEEMTDRVREIFSLRMALLPYLYSAFVRYHDTGRPPFRALVMDHPDDQETYKLDDEYYMGEDMIIAPLTAESDTRRVYLPQGKWHDFFTGEVLEGGWRDVTCPLQRLPVYDRDNTLLPLAQPEACAAPSTVFTLVPRVYGKAPSPTMLYEDDGISLNGPRNECVLHLKDGHFVLDRQEGSAPICYRIKEGY
jgi:alpha-D-xyloside xylohydrolase